MISELPRIVAFYRFGSLPRRTAVQLSFALHSARAQANSGIIRVTGRWMANLARVKSSNPILDEEPGRPCGRTGANR